MIDLEGLTLSPQEKTLLQHPAVGGIIFFSRNFQSVVQISALAEEIHAIREDILICVDQEGGRVQRFRDGFTRLPAMQVLGDLIVQYPGSEQFLTDAGWLMASELLACGIDFSFAPVLDVDRCTCEVIADRSFSDDPEVVIHAAGAFIAGMNEAGMAATGKHFPGHGGVTVDSHLATPYDPRDLATIRQRDMLPFKALSQSLAAIMPAHMIYSNINADSVGFSPFWLQEILRGELNFQGVIFSDDLTMKGADVVGGYVDKARCALNAGCDMVLVCNNRSGALEVLHYLEKTDLPGSDRLKQMKASKTADWASLKGSSRWLATRERLTQLVSN